MFKKSTFKEGEERICKECGVTFIPKKPRNVCPPCVNTMNRISRNIKIGKGATADYAEKRGRNKSDLEGITFEERRKGWVKRSRFLEKELKERTQWQEFFRNEFDRILSDKELWKSLTRESLGALPRGFKEDSEEELKPGRKVPKSKQYPDTRSMTWEEWERGGYGGLEDS